MEKKSETINKILEELPAFVDYFEFKKKLEKIFKDYNVLIK